MNPNNYASLEASKRLVNAGIVLETDAVWIYARHIPLKGADRIWKLFDRRSLMAIEVTEQRPSALIPAPSMAEVWRELSSFITREWDFANKLILTIKKMPFGITDCYYGDTTEKLCSNINPTDALIDLLIWVRKEKL